MTLADDFRELNKRTRQANAKLKVLFFDIETAPSLAHVWQAKTRFVGAHQVVHDTFMLCWSAKWEDSDHVYHDRLGGHDARKQRDRRIVASLAEKIREADIVCAHNADRFDIPTLNSRLMRLGEEPIGPVKTLDTLKLAKKSFRLFSNKLDYLAGVLGLEGKHDTNFDLWLDCYHGEAGALAQMDLYCRQDVKVLQKVYEHLKPYVKGLPRLVDAAGDSRVCPTCGSSDVVEDDIPYRTNASTFPRFVCNECGRHSRGRKHIKSRKLELRPL